MNETHTHTHTHTTPHEKRLVVFFGLHHGVELLKSYYAAPPKWRSIKHCCCTSVCLYHAPIAKKCVL